MSLLRYYIPDHGETAEDSHALPGGRTDCPRQFAAEAAYHCQFQRDGWEWDWPKVFVVIDGGGKEWRFSVDREMVPEFFATEIKPSK